MLQIWRTEGKTRCDRMNRASKRKPANRRTACAGDQRQTTVFQNNVRIDNPTSHQIGKPTSNQTKIIGESNDRLLSRIPNPLMSVAALNSTTVPLETMSLPQEMQVPIAIVVSMGANKLFWMGGELFEINR